MALPLAVAPYLVDHAGALTVRRLSRRLSAVSKVHVLSGQPDLAYDPAVR